MILRCACCGKEIGIVHEGEAMRICCPGCRGAMKPQPTREMLQKHMEAYAAAEERGLALVKGCGVAQRTEWLMYKEMTAKAMHMKEAIEGLFLDLDGKLPK
jgi:hypothetical protein